MDAAAVKCGRVVLEGRFRRAGIIRRKDSGFRVTGSALVQVVQRSDGTHVLRLSQVTVSNPMGVRLRVYLYLKDPMGGTRSIKNKWLDSFGDKLWMESLANGEAGTVA